MKKCFIACCAFVLSATTMAQQSGYIRFDKSRLYYEKKGTGPAILFLHGGFLDHTMWEKQVRFFSKQFTVITIDLPGHGKTLVLDSTMLIADVIHLCLDSLHIDRASLVGLSMGASCAVDFAIAYPEKVVNLILASPGLSGGPDVINMDSISFHAFTLADSVEQSKDNKKFAEVFTNNWCIGLFRKPNEVDHVIREYVYNQVLFTVENHHNDSWPLFQKNPRAAKLLPAIKNKLFIIEADKDIPYIDSACNYFYKNVKGAKKAIMHHVAHMVNLEQPDQFNILLADFLRE